MMANKLPVILLVSFCGVLGTYAPAQDDEPKGPDEEVEAKLDELKDIVSDRKFERDAEAPQIITFLLQKWQDGLVERDQKDVVKGFAMVLLKGKLRPVDQTLLYTAAAAALGETGEMGAKPLQQAFESKRFPDKPGWVPLREALLRALGKTKNERHVKFLIDTARRHPEAALQAAAGEALGNFDHCEEKVRKEIVENLLIRYGTMDSRARVIDPADIEAQNMRNRLAVISKKWNDTLRKMTKANFDTYPDWQDWWNDNKNERWDR